MLNAITWDFDPTIFEILGKEIRWYALLFGGGLLVLGPMIAERMWKHERLNADWLNSLYMYVVLATIIGARLGHVLFYDPAYYLANPHKILYTWEGGLASHGGTLGIIIALWFYSKYVTKRSILFALDRIAVPTGLVAAMIRLGNLANSEIFGEPTELAWGFRFVRSEEYWSLVPDGSLGCHPTQIYEAMAYLLLFALSMWMYWRKDMARRYEGLIFGVFIAGVFGFRYLVEGIKNVQEPWEVDMIATYGLNMGQLLSIPFVLVGIWLSWRALKHPLMPSPESQKTNK